MVCSIEKDFLREVKDDDVIKQFQVMKKKKMTNQLGFCFTLFIYYRFFSIV
ncbi:hypothetical protein Hanom_Chr17g01550471 [Helianthus anomalus]